MAESGLHCSVWDLHRVMWDLSLQLTDSLVVAPELSSCGMGLLRERASVAVVHELSCSSSCGILVPQLVTEPMSLHCKVDPLSLGHQGSPSA